jgi:dTDP-4-dehydrorhamnose reductase
MKRNKDVVEVWGGLECTINRVKNDYFDQLEYAGHYYRGQDIQRIADLGIKTMRYPVLWEKHQPHKDTEIDWTLTKKKLDKIRSLNMDIIAGLVHHGSGPAYVHMLEESFVQGLAEYAAKVAEQFPWITYYTPVNEPLTTARFCGLYGIWYPHGKTDPTFCRVLINECKATVLAMQAIRKVNPQAKLVQTDDLGKTHSTELLKYQAEFDNNRRWLSYDLLCGMVTETHPLWHYLLSSGITSQELHFFTENKCPPDVMGFNYYLTSERYLDENKAAYPVHTHGGNGKHRYADVEAVRVGHVCPDGLYAVLKEAWERYNLPMAVTEVHLHCTREEQMRWLQYVWHAAVKLKSEGIDIKAITAWALLGSFGWNKLLTEKPGDYEPGVFDVSGEAPYPTALADMIKAYNTTGEYDHPVIKNAGWWQRKQRVIYGTEAFFDADTTHGEASPVLIMGGNGPVANAFAEICKMRGLHYIKAGRWEMDTTTNPDALENLIRKNRPWAVINTTGVNTSGAENLAILCNNYNIKLLTFSTPIMFDGVEAQLQTGEKASSKVYVHPEVEETVMLHHPNALVIRISAYLFGAYDSLTLDKFEEQGTLHTSLDMLIDDKQGVWQLGSGGKISWAGAVGRVRKISA